MSRRLCALLLALTLAVFSASAGFSPSLEALRDAYGTGQAFRLRAGVWVTAWPDLAPETLAAVQAWLADAELTLTVRDAPGLRSGLASLSKAGAPLFTAYTGMQDGRPALVLEAPGGLAATRYLGTEEWPPWEALLGTRLPLPDLAGAAPPCGRRLSGPPACFP